MLAPLLQQSAAKCLDSGRLAQMQWPLGQLQQSAALWVMPRLAAAAAALAAAATASTRDVPGAKLYECDGTRLGCYLSRKGGGHTFRNHTHLLHGRLVGCIGLVGCRRQCTQQAAQCRSCQIVSDLERSGVIKKNDACWHKEMAPRPLVWRLMPVRQ